MGEEEKKPEETKVEVKKPEEPKKAEEEKKEAEKKETAALEKKPEESKDAKDGKESKAEAAPPPPPPPEIVLKVFMHCEGCARKVRRCLKGFPGVEDVITDCKSHRVVVKGEKADPLKVLERVQKKSHRQVELLSPIPKPPVPEEEKKPQEKEKPKPEEKKEEIVTVVLKVHMHCEACSQEIRRRIQRMKGVESAEPDLKNSQVSVKGVFDPAKLVDYVYKRTGKQVMIVKQEPEKKEKAAKEEKKTEEGDEEKKESEGETKPEEKKKEEAEGEAKIEEPAKDETNTVVEVEVKKSEYHYYPPRYGTEFYAYATYGYGTQIFSDENPNACSVM